jgi:glutamyl-Q tRNA(Asp) synthetase
MSEYVGRFAPSPTGPLHKGSLVAAVASFLDARCRGGIWLVRIEDIDEGRVVRGADHDILACLSALGMRWDGEVVSQRQRKTLYQATFERLDGHVYPCGCTRKEIADSQVGIASDGGSVYPGTCRSGLAPGRTARAYRLRVPDDSTGVITFEDRWVGRVSQCLATDVGDFILKRADGFWAYQLAVVVDDAVQGVTHVVRGADLLDSTPRQIYLQRLLGFPTPRYLHVPVVTNDLGEKLSKQSGARALDLSRPVDELLAAARFLQLPISQAASVEDFWQRVTPLWAVAHSD